VWWGWVVRCWRGYLSGARCRLAYGPCSWCHCHSLSLAPVKSRLVLPFWYRPTRVVLEKKAVKRVCVGGGLLITRLRKVYCWVCEWKKLAKLQARTWLSRALTSPFSNVLTRRAKCVRQRRSGLWLKKHTAGRTARATAYFFDPLCTWRFVKSHAQDKRARNICTMQWKEWRLVVIIIYHLVPL